MKHISVVIADDHAMLREGLSLLFKKQPDIEVIGEAIDGIEAIEMVRALKPDVILLDIAMPKLTGLESIGLLRDVSPDTRVIMLSSHGKEAYVHQALNDGASGYVVKGSPSAEVLTAIRNAANNQYPNVSDVHSLDIDSCKTVKNPVDQSSETKTNLNSYTLLSEREIQVFHLLIEGNNSNQISDLLCISTKTVDKHRASIYRKVGVKNPIQLLRYAIQIGVVDPALWQE